MNRGVKEHRNHRWRVPFDQAARVAFLEAVAASDTGWTSDIVDSVRGRDRYTEKMAYDRLRKLEAEGLVDKEIVFGATSIGTAIWTLTESGRKLLVPDQQGEES